MPQQHYTNAVDNTVDSALDSAAESEPMNDILSGPMVDAIESDLNTGRADSYEPSTAGTAIGFVLTSAAFANGANIPPQYTCDGAGQSPPLSWRGAPKGTRSLALIAHDPDASRDDYDFTHWIVFDIPVTTDRIAAGAGEAEAGLPGSNDFGRVGYGGPCPPPGQGAHRYVFTLFALGTDLLSLGRGATRADVETAIQGHILAQTTLLGTYERH